MESSGAGNSKFKIGEAVQLISGGPRMTVVEADDSEAMVACKWFDKDERLRNDKFPSAALTDAQPTLADLREFLNGPEK